MQSLWPQRVRQPVDLSWAGVKGENGKESCSVAGTQTANSCCWCVPTVRAYTRHSAGSRPLSACEDQALEKVIASCEKNSPESCTLWCYSRSLNKKIHQTIMYWDLHWKWDVMKYAELFACFVSLATYFLSHETALFLFVVIWNTEISYLVHNHSTLAWHRA